MVKRYPFLETAAKHGRGIAAALGVVIALSAVCLLLAGAPVIGSVAVLIAAPVVFIGLRIAAELIEVVADTLMPR